MAIEKGGFLAVYDQNMRLPRKNRCAHSILRILSGFFSRLLEMRPEAASRDALSEPILGYQSSRFAIDRREVVNLNFGLKNGRTILK
jgi:hypothetical protein